MKFCSLPETSQTVEARTNTLLKVNWRPTYFFFSTVFIQYPPRLWNKNVQYRYAERPKVTITGYITKLQNFIQVTNVWLSITYSETVWDRKNMILVVLSAYLVYSNVLLFKLEKWIKGTWYFISLMNLVGHNNVLLMAQFNILFTYCSLF